jgi:hypothetical protein
MIRLKNLLTESTTPDFSYGMDRLKSQVQKNMKTDGKDQEEIDSILTLIDKAKLSLAKHYVSEWKNKIPKTKAISNDDSKPTSQQKVQIISATKNWIRKVITDLSPSLDWSYKWKLKIAWPFVEWEQIDSISSDILYGIQNSIEYSDASELEKEWIAWGEFYLIKDRDFTEEMFDIIVD